jgi:hypothetical protein
MTVVLDQACRTCGKHVPLIPLHGDKGGPLMCFICSGEWHAKHGKLRKLSRIVMRAMQIYLREGGRSTDIDQMLSSVRLQSLGMKIGGYEPEQIGSEAGDLTSELLADTLRLTHPDMHPPERGELAKRVTQELLALKPFTFPASKPEPSKKNTASNTSSNSDREPLEKPSQPPYPCAECARTTPEYYCDPCRTRWDAEDQKRREHHQKDRERRNARQRQRYAERKRYQHILRPPKICPACNMSFKPKRQDTRYCSQACRQRAYVQRDGKSSDEPPEINNIENAVAAAFKAEPDNALTTNELCARIYPEIGHVEKKHRVAVLSAAKQVIERQWNDGHEEAWDWFRRETRGGEMVFFNCASVMSYGMARQKGDWLIARAPEERLKAELEPGGRNHEYVVEGGAWWRHLQDHVAKRKEEREKGSAL